MTSDFDEVAAAISGVVGSLRRAVDLWEEPLMWLGGAALALEKYEAATQVGEDEDDCPRSAFDNCSCYYHEGLDDRD